MPLPAALRGRALPWSDRRRIEHRHIRRSIWPVASRGCIPAPGPTIRAARAASLDHAHFLVVALGPRMHRHRHAFERLLEIDRLRGGMRGGELIEVGPQRLGHGVYGV